MPAAHGRLTRIYMSGYDLTGYYRKASSELMREAAESTVFNVTDKTYIPGRRDATASLEGLVADSVDGLTLSFMEDLETDPTLLNVCPQGDVLGNVAYGLRGRLTTLDLETPADDIFAITNELQSQVGRDRLLVQHTLSTEVASGQSASIDNTVVSTLNGGVGYLQVPDITGITNLSVLIEDSADNSAFATILTFPGVTADRGRLRVEITGTVRRYTRCRWVFTGAGSANFWAGFGRR